MADANSPDDKNNLANTSFFEQLLIFDDGDNKKRKSSSVCAKLQPSSSRLVILIVVVILLVISNLMALVFTTRAMNAVVKIQSDLSALGTMCGGKAISQRYSSPGQGQQRSRSDDRTKSQPYLTTKTLTHDSPRSEATCSIDNLQMKRLFSTLDAISLQTKQTKSNLGMMKLSVDKTLGEVDETKETIAFIQKQASSSGERWMKAGDGVQLLQTKLTSLIDELRNSRLQIEAVADDLGNITVSAIENATDVLLQRHDNDTDFLKESLKNALETLQIAFLRNQEQVNNTFDEFSKKIEDFNEPFNQSLKSMFDLLRNADNRTRIWEDILLIHLNGSLGDIVSTMLDVKEDANRSLSSLQMTLKEIHNKSLELWTDASSGIDSIESMLSGSDNTSHFLYDIDAHLNILEQSLVLSAEEMTNSSKMLFKRVDEIESMMNSSVFEIGVGVTSLSNQISTNHDDIEKVRTENIKSHTSLILNQQSITKVVAGLNTVISYIRNASSNTLDLAKSSSKVSSTLEKSMKDLWTETAKLSSQMETRQNPPMKFCAKGKTCQDVQGAQKVLRCFKLSTIRATWDNAKQVCKSLGGKLVEILDTETLQFVDSLAKTAAWVGATDRQREGDWRWVESGRKVGLANWVPGQPDNWGRNEHCMHTRGTRGRNWNDLGCNSKLLYICEKFSTTCTEWML